MKRRPAFIKHWRDIQEEDDACYPDSSERLSIGSPFGHMMGLQRIGIHHEVLPPGRRTSTTKFIMQRTLSKRKSVRIGGIIGLNKKWDPMTVFPIVSD